MIDKLNTKLSGRLFSPNTASFVVAEMWRDAEGLYWLESTVDPATCVEIEQITPAVGRVPIVITLAKMGRFETNMGKLPVGFQPNSLSDRLHWLEQFSFIKTVGWFVGIVAILFGLRAIVPQIGDIALFFVPQSADVALGNQVEETIETFFEPTELSKTEQQKAQQLFKPLSEKAFAGTAFVPKLLLRKSDFLGANAIALPNGTVVLTDGLWNLMQDYPDEIQAVLAHEVMHVRFRHGMRQMLHYAALSSLIFLIGLEGSSIEELSLVITQISQAGYSRAFELEADTEAVHLMHSADIDPMALSRGLARLTLAGCGENGCGEGGWFASHPDFPDRRKNIQRAAGR